MSEISCGNQNRRPLRAGRLFLALLAFAACGTLATLAGVPASVASPGAKPACPGSLQAKIDAAPPGSTVELARDCVYREAVTVDKPLTLGGSGKGEIRGSDVWDDWKRSGPVWISAKPVPRFAAPERSICEDTSRRCLWHEQVYSDGSPLVQVASNPGPGQFALDGGRRVLLGENPEGRFVEVTTRSSWVVGASDGVTVRGITMKHAAETGLWNGGRSGWTVESNDLSYAHEKNLALTLGGGLVARDNDLHDAGQLGMSSNEADVEIVGNRVYDNNTEEFSAVWEAGGMKIAQPRTAWIVDNEVYRNEEIGIWVDVVNRDQTSVEIGRNRVHHHPRQGIRVEITKNFNVHDNVVWENGWEQGDSYNGSGISVNGSRDGVVEGNILAWNASGIGVIQQDRNRAHEQPYDTTSNVRLNDNKIVQDEVPGTVNHAAVFWNEDTTAVAKGATGLSDPAAGNSGSNNAYWFDEPEGEAPRFKWEAHLRSLADYNATPAEKDGRYLNKQQKDAVLRDNGLPAAPEAHPSPPGGPGGFVAEIMVWVRSLLS